jgi:hypothetical protein
MLTEWLVTCSRVLLTCSAWNPHKITAPVWSSKPTPPHDLWRSLWHIDHSLTHNSFWGLTTPISADLNKSFRSWDLKYSLLSLPTLMPEGVLLLCFALINLPNPHISATPTLPCACLHAASLSSSLINLLLLLLACLSKFFYQPWHQSSRQDRVKW